MTPILWINAIVEHLTARHGRLDGPSVPTDTLIAMLLYAGIDEAGYGPMFGPLCVAACVFEVSNHDAAAGAPNLWTRLERVVCRSRRDAPKKIAVDDSKHLKGPPDGKQHPLLHLERGVLAFGSALGAIPGDDAGLLARLGAAVPDVPWYDSTTDLPLGTAAARLGIDASRLRRAMREAGVALRSLRCVAIDAGPFNTQIDRTGSKAAVNLSTALRLVDEIWPRDSTEEPHVVIDRHGGRVFYREDLQQAWPEAQIRILNESEAISRYRLERAERALTVSFVREAEARHLPVALASMTAKYVRELLMLRLNRFFTGHLPELKPTAGYVQDGRRYLQEIGPVMQRLGFERSSLVRRV
ncbi:MAG: hypothetical protein ACYTGG_03645 [Planctomycetota bacterium]|jgi:ribonuclease HII